VSLVQIIGELKYFFFPLAIDNNLKLPFIFKCSVGYLFSFGIKFELVDDVVICKFQKECWFLSIALHGALPYFQLLDYTLKATHLRVGAQVKDVADAFLLFSCSYLLRSLHTCSHFSVGLLLLLY
jgi:hypothetical protein